MTDEEIKIADWIISRYKMSATGFGELTADGRRIAKYLVAEGFVKLGSGYISLTPKGEEFQNSGKSYRDYLAEKREREERQQRKDEVDMNYKLMQIRESRLKLDEPITLTAEEIKCANCTILNASFSHAKGSDIMNSNSIPPHIFRKVSTFLLEEDIIKEVGPGGGWDKEYALTTKGNRMFENKINIEAYLEDLKRKFEEQREKQRLEEYHTKLQVQKLERELVEKEHVQSIADVISFLLCFSPVIAVTFYFIKVNLNWNGFMLGDPLTWVNTENFGKTEVLMIATDVFLVGVCAWAYKKIKTPFRTFLSLLLRQKKDKSDSQ